MEPIWLLCLFIACAFLSLSLCWIAKLLFPKFRSGEFKPGPHRSDMLPGSGREIKTIELPLVGGPALTLAIIGTGILAGYLFHFNDQQWHLLLIGLGATVGYMAVGLVDDWKKVFSKEGLSERGKLGGVFLVSITAAACYYFFYRPGPDNFPYSPTQPYSPYLDILGPIFHNFPF